jgi:hypothetical protein
MINLLPLLAILLVGFVPPITLGLYGRNHKES